MPRKSGVSDAPDAALEQDRTRSSSLRKVSDVDRSGEAFSAIDATAEAALIAAAVADPSVLDDADELAPLDFGVRAHQVVWQAILACDASGRSVDPVSVADEIVRAGELGVVGGPEGLDNIFSTAPAVAEQVRSYMDVVLDRSLRRRVLSASRNVASSALDPSLGGDALTSAVEEAVYAATSTASDTGPVTMPQLIADLHARMATARSTHLVGHSTGFAGLDKVTGGFGAGQLVVVAARPGVGKSVLLLQMARHIADTTDALVPFYSYEMSAEEIGFRLLSSATGIPLQDLIVGRVPSGMDRVLASEAEKLAACRLLIVDSPPASIAGLRSSVRRLARRGPLGAVFVDYLQLMRADGVRDANRTQEVSVISRELKLMAKELSTSAAPVPVIAASQLNRAVETRTGSRVRPMLSDLRDSGSIEQDSNVVLFLHRDSMYRPEAPADEMELIVGKNRQGASGVTIPLTWQGDVVRMREDTRDRTPPPSVLAPSQF